MRCCPEAETELRLVGSGSSSPELDYECISAFLLDRALREFEFEDVRKLSAELCGRIHPQEIPLTPYFFTKLSISAT
ncbi:hypothetical protein P8452_66607 [Trifolium repens]|nr:hypothetical protein P8452_66607 [Trifolium repens]